MTETPTENAKSEATMIDRAGLVDIYETLAQVKTNTKQVFYRHRAVAIRKALEPVVSPIIEMREDVKKKLPKEFDDKRAQLCQLHAEKTAEGHPVISNNNYVIDETQRKAFDHAFSNLTAESKPARDAYQKEVDEINEWLRSEIPLPEIKERFPFSCFNEDTPQELLETLFFLIDMDVAEPAKKAEKK